MQKQVLCEEHRVLNRFRVVFSSSCVCFLISGLAQLTNSKEAIPPARTLAQSILCDALGPARDSGSSVRLESESSSTLVQRDRETQEP